MQTRGPSDEGEMAEHSVSGWCSVNCGELDREQAGWQGHGLKNGSGLTRAGPEVPAQPVGTRKGSARCIGGAGSASAPGSLACGSRGAEPAGNWRRRATRGGGKVNVGPWRSPSLVGVPSPSWSNIPGGYPRPVTSCRASLRASASPGGLRDAPEADPDPGNKAPGIRPGAL